MQPPIFIRRIFAIIAIVVLAFGIMPKRSLHNLVASHKDGRADIVKGSVDDNTLSKAVFNCQCDNLVIESPFVEGVVAISFKVTIPSPAYESFAIHDVANDRLFHFCRRGPPAA